jgi:hypothetical protein
MMALASGCNHRAYPIVIVTTEMGNHARCLNCESVGQPRPNSEAARQAFLGLGER